MPVLSAPTFTILPDHDIGQDDPAEIQDFFSFESRLAPIFDVLRHKDTRTPIAMAICGAAGTGKTTALDWLEQSLNLWSEVPDAKRGEHPSIISVRFSARSCTHAEEATSALLGELVLAAMAFLDDGTGQQRLDRMKRAVMQGGSVLGRGFVQSLEGLSRRWSVLETLRVNMPSSGGEQASARVSCRTCVDLMEEWFKVYEGKHGPVRIALLIDDLDQVQSDVMMAIFDFINVQLRSPIVEFVVAHDPQITAKLINTHYEQHKFNEMQVRNYLSKIFQVECDIEPSQQQVLSFYNAQYEQLDKRSRRGLSTWLTPEYKQYVDAAILQLSGGNPRKIKLLLNSAFMKGHAALCVADRDKVSKEERSLAFLQHVQLYLLQQWLSFFSVGGSAIYRNDVLKWFNVISEEARAPESQYEELEKRLEQNKEVETPVGLGLHIIHPWVWDLLRIPFSSATAGEYREYEPPVVSEEAPEVVEVEDLTGDLDSASAVMKDALAAALMKSVDELTEEDVERVEEIDLSEKNLNARDCAVMRRMTGMLRLDLHNSMLDCLGSIKNMKNLRSLNLTCTQMSNIEPLRELVELRSLDLSFSQIDDISPLEGHQKLENLVLYGTNVTDLAPLKNLEALTRLNLSCTGVDDDQLEVLKHLPNLETLFLRQTKVTLGAASKLNKNFEFGLKIER